MKTGKVFRRIAILLSLVMLLTSTVGTTYGYIISSTEPLVNVFVPEGAPVAKLSLSKTVEHPLGSNYKIPDNICFDFTVELGAYYANARVNTTAGEMTADENGMLTLSLRPGESLTLEDLEEGTQVKVTEQDTALRGFKVKGDATQTATAGADGTVGITFVNTYSPARVKPENITVGGLKVLEGRQWQEGDSFTFKLEQHDGNNWKELGTAAVTYDGENADFDRFDFSEVFQALTFDKVGTYTFRMYEVTGELENVDYDKTVNHFTVVVTDVDMDGKLEINTVSGTENAAVTKEGGKYAVSATFNNTFIPPVVDPDPVTIQIHVAKTVTNKGSLKCGPEGFEFVLENTETAVKQAVKSDAKGKAAFDLTFTKADIGKTYTYKLSETNHGKKDMTYDADVHTLTVSVSMNDENKLVTALTMDGVEVTDLHAAFENIYDADQIVVPPTGDEANLNVWFIMMIVSAAALVALIIYDRKCSRA